MAHKMDVSQNLMSLSVLADDNLVSILDKHKIIVFKDKTVTITLSEPPVLEGSRRPNGLWMVPIITPETNPTIDSYYDNAVANSAVASHNNKSLWNIPLPTSSYTATSAAPTTLSASTTLAASTTHCAHSAYT